MKFVVTMKDPDTLYDAIREAVVKELESFTFLKQDEINTLAEGRIEETAKIADRWFRYGEYLSVEIDTEKRTCIVLSAENGP